jgi:hypothetical protein
MKVGQIRTMVEDKSDNELVFIAWYDKDEAEELIQNNLMEDFGASNEVKLTHEEWVEIYSSMVDDEGIWQQMNEAFHYYVQKVVEQRAKGETNDDSK